MKTDLIKFTVRSMKNLRDILAGLITILIFFNVLPKARGVNLYWTGNTGNPATADSGTWTTTTASGPFSWSSVLTPPITTTPWANGSVAHFLGSGGGTVTLGSPITAAGINFDSGASAFTIATNGNVLTIQGTGVVNNSGATQTITNIGATAVSSASSLAFSGTAITGTGGVIINNNGATTVSGTATATSGGFTDFLQATSNAGSATINNNGGTVAFSGGATAFGRFTAATATAGSATINNNAGTGVNSEGFTDFATTSTAGSATINNNGGTVAGSGGSTQFLDSSTAGSATIINNSGTVAGSGGRTFFFATSNAGSATIINNGGTGSGSGGTTQFLGGSDGGTAHAITNGNASFDISGLTTVGMGIGSIEGSGNYFLGSKTLTVGGNNASTTVSGVIQDGGINGGAGGSLTKIGTGTLTLAGVNTYTGITTINAGVLSISQDANLGTAPVTPVPNQLTFNGGTLQATATFTLNTNRGATLNAGGGTFDVTDANVLTYGGVITGPGSLTETGTGTLILTGVNTYTGITTLHGGVLSISQDANLGAAPGTAVPNQLTFNFGTLEATASFTLNPNRGITLVGTNDTISVTGANVLTYGGIITGAGSLLKGDTGTLILSGANTYTGITTINAGVLSISQDANLGTVPGTPVSNQLTFNGGTLQATTTFTLNTNRGITLNAGGGTFDVTDANVLTYGGVITGPGSLAKVGTGTLTLLGSNTFSGVTTITAGTLQLGNGGTTGSITGDVSNGGVLVFDRSNLLTFGGVISGGGSVNQIGTGTTILTGNNTYTGGTTINGGTLQLGNGGTTGTIVGNVANNGILAFDRSNTLMFGGLISGPGSVTQIGTGTTILTGNNTYAGGTTISAGTLQLGNGGTTGAIIGDVINNGVLSFDRSDIVTFGGLISGAGAVTQIGTGTTILTGNNTYAGGTTISAGTLQLGNGGTAGAIIGDVVDNGVLSFDRSDSVTFGGLISGAGSLTQLGTGTTILTGNNTYTGGTTISAGTLQLGNGGTTGSIVGDLLDNAVLVFDRSDTVTFGGLISGAGSVNQAGTGTTILTNNNTYSGGTTISAGTLQLGNGGTTGSIVGNVLDNGVLVFDRSDTATFGGLISGAGSVSQAGTGTTILTNNNTYTGGTTISAGTLQLGNGGTTGSIVGNVIDNSVLAFNRSDPVTFGGIVSGTGALVNIGTGTLTLTGSNTYTGGTTISAGRLQIGNGGTSGSITGNVLDNSVLAFNRSDSLTFGGIISGTGSVNQMGTGTTILTGTNTYTGGTTISAGTLQIGNGGTTGSITGNVLDNGLLVFDRSDSVTFGGVISGTGGLIQQGTGVLRLPGANTYTGTTLVNSGSLIVDGAIGSLQTIVNPGGLLGGHGTIGGNLINNGIVGQLLSPGTLTVLGNFIQNAGGTLRIGVGGLTAGLHDVLAVNGHVTLGGTLQVVNLGSFSLQPGNQVLFLTANHGVSGSFSSVLTGTIVQGLIISLPNGVLLEGKQGSFTEIPGVTLTPNEAAVGKALNSAAGDPRAAALIAFLNSQPVADLPHDLALIAPTQITSINATAVSLGNIQLSNLEQRLGDVRGGSTGFSSSGFAISGPSASLGQGFAGVTGPEGKGGPSVFAPTPSNRWGVFLTGLGEFTNVDSTPNAPGYDVDTGGFTFGVDYRLTPNFAVGLTAGYAHTSVHPEGGGNIDVNGGKIGLYATAFANGFYLDAAVSGGPSGYNTRRTALLGTASGSTDGADVNALVAAGYDWKYGNWTLGPTASFQFDYIGLDGFTETGSLAPLKFPDQNTESERTAFGGKASYDWKVGHVTVIPQVSAAWQHEYGDTEYSVAANFASGAGSSFTVRGPHIGRDSLLIGAGATVIWNDRVSTYLYYDGEVARTNYESHNVSGGVRISF